MRMAQLVVDRWGRVVMTGESGKRYEFTRKKRALPIEDEDVELFRSKRVRVSECGCTGGHRDGDYVYMFNIMEV